MSSLLAARAAGDVRNDCRAAQTRDGALLLSAKGGPHLQRLSSGAQLWTRAAAIVKAVDNSAALRQANPNAVTIHRHYFEPAYPAGRSPENIVDETLSTLGGFMPTYVQLFNETRQRMPAFADHVELMTACTAILHSRGYKVLGSAFSTGEPQDTEWLYWQSHAFSGVDAIAGNEYWALLDVPIPLRFTIWNALRHRQVHALLKIHPPFIITEAGRDMVRDGDNSINGGYVGEKGWRNDGISAEDYIAECQAYEAELQKDDYVIGWVLFNGGGWANWSAYEWEEIAESLAKLFYYDGQPLLVKPSPPDVTTPSHNNGGMHMAIDKVLAQAAIDIIFGQMERLKKTPYRMTKPQRLALANDVQSHLLTIKGELEKA